MIVEYINAYGYFKAREKDGYETIRHKIKSISDEYSKIQAKESKLSANERRLIVELYNKTNN